MKKIFVGGINGCGKSTILDNLYKIKKDVEVVHGSKHFMKWLGIKNGDYKKLESLSTSFKNREINKMIRSLFKNPPSKAKWIFLDAHYLRIHNGKITKAVGDWISLFDGLFVFVARPEEILRRIDTDIVRKNRSKSMFSENLTEVDKSDRIKELKKFLMETVEEVKHLSNKFKIPYFIIDNNQPVERTCKCVVGLLDKLYYKKYAQQKKEKSN